MTRTLFAAALLLAAVPALAQDSPAQVVTRYVQASVAAEACKLRQLSAADHERITVMSLQARTGDLPAGDQLSVSNQARGYMEARVASTGCQDREVREALRFFEQQILPGLQ